MVDDGLLHYLMAPQVDQWSSIGNSPVERFTSESLATFCHTLVERFTQDMLLGVKALQTAGFRFTSDEPINVFSEPKEFDLPAPLPPLLSAWCRSIERIDLTQETRQMLDVESPFRGFGMFGIDLKWITPTDLTDSEGCLFFQSGRWYLNAFTTAGQLIIHKPTTVDCLMIDGDDQTHSLYHSMRRFAQYGGFSRVELASKASLRLAPKPQSLPGTFPQPLSF